MCAITLQEKFVRATEVICRQGLIPFPASPTALAIVQRVVGEVEDELDLIHAFRDNPSQTLEQLAAASGFPAAKACALAESLAQKGLVFNQPNSSGLMVYRLLPLMMIGLMEYKFMGRLTGSEEEKALAGLFEKMLADLREQTQGSYDALLPLFKAAPAIDRTVPAGRTADGRPIRVIPVDNPAGGALPHPGAGGQLLHLRQVGAPHRGPGFRQARHPPGGPIDSKRGRTGRPDPQGFSPGRAGIRCGNQHLQLLQGLLRHLAPLARRHAAPGQLHLSPGRDRRRGLHRLRHLRGMVPHRSDCPER
jgi:hypothetical protein